MTNHIAGLGISPALPQATPASPAAAEEGGFGTLLSDALQQVEQLHQDAQQQVGQLLEGGQKDVHNVMIAVEKADLAFQLMMQVRNKIVSAYQEISRMQF